MPAGIRNREAMMMNQRLKDLNLLLLYLSGWEEESKKHPGELIFRAWRGYLFEVLHELEEEGLVYQHHKMNTIILTNKGICRAKVLNAKTFKE